MEEKHKLRIMTSADLKRISGIDLEAFNRNPERANNPNRFKPRKLKYLQALQQEFPAGNFVYEVKNKIEA